jgi:hypothetical protein
MPTVKVKVYRTAKILLCRSVDASRFQSDMTSIPRLPKVQRKFSNVDPRGDALPLFQFTTQIRFGLEVLNRHCLVVRHNDVDLVEIDRSMTVIRNVEEETIGNLLSMARNRADAEFNFQRPSVLSALDDKVVRAEAGAPSSDECSNPLKRCSHRQHDREMAVSGATLRPRRAGARRARLFPPFLRQSKLPHTGHDRRHRADCGAYQSRISNLCPPSCFLSKPCFNKSARRKRFRFDDAPNRSVNARSRVPVVQLGAHGVNVEFF